jgi:hypothetical protein
MNNFFGSKLNTVLLLILIVLMVGTLHFMWKEKETYLPYLNNEEEVKVTPAPAPQIEGNKDDLVSFSVKPGDKVSGVLAYQGVVKGAYFFEANIRINILDKNKKVLKQDHALATTDWMTAGPVSFGGIIDLTGLPKGDAYFEIHNDNPSDLPQNDKSILIPIVIE